MELIELGSILEMTKGKKPVKCVDSQQEGYLPYVDIEAFEEHNYKKFTDGEKCLPCEDGDILIVCDGSRSGLVGRAVKGYVGSTLAKISAKGMNSDYLYHFVQGKYALLNTRKKGTGTPHLNPEILKQQRLIVPTHKEQERIVKRIDEMFSELDSGVVTLEKTMEQVAVYKLSILKEAFGRIEEYTKFGDVSESRLGKMLDKEKNIGTPREYLRNINVRWFSFDLADLLEMRISDNEIDKYSLKKGDLVICEGGEPGRCAIWDRDESIFYQKALHRVRFSNDHNPKFYMYYMWFAAQTGLLKQYYTGTGIKHLTGQSLVKIPVPSAGLDVQNRTVDVIESHLSECDNIEQTIKVAVAQAESMRQSIIKDAFEGRL